MKILVLSALYPPYNVGGAEKSVSLIAAGLAQRGHDVSVLTVHEGKALRHDQLDGVRITYVPLRNLYWPSAEGNSPSSLAKLVFHGLDTLNFLMAGAVKDAIKAERPDIVLSNNLVLFSALVWRPIGQAGIPILHSIRDFYLLCPNSKMFRNGTPCIRQCRECRVLAQPRRMMSTHVDGVTSVSQYMIDRHRGLGVFPNALALPPILSAADVPIELPAREARGADLPVRFGYIGRVAPEKGLDVLVNGLRAADPARWSLKIAGRGPSDYMADLRRRCAGLPVEFLGFVPASEVYASIDIAAVPSVWEEPLPRTLLEAFGYGLPVLGSTRGGIPEVLEHGKTGYLVDVDNPENVASTIARIIAHPDEARAFGLAGRAVAMARSGDRVAREYEAAIHKVMTRKLQSAA